MFQLTTEERLYLHAARVGDYGLVREILESADLCHATSGEQHGINVNCIDYMGRNALHLAVDSENSDCIKLLLDRLSCECQEEVKLLSQISKKVSKCQFVERITFPVLHQLGYLKKSALNFDLTNWQKTPKALKLSQVYDKSEKIKVKTNCKLVACCNFKLVSFNF